MLDQTADGVALFDAGLRLLAWSRSFGEIWNLAPPLLSRGVTLQSLIRSMAERGDYGAESAEAIVREYTSGVEQPYIAERMLADGRVLEFRRNPLPDGSFVLACRDVTERRHTEYLFQDSARDEPTIDRRSEAVPQRVSI
jgi:PAS domain-containing protein